MNYFSTRRISPNASFREAVELGQPDDRGLFFPSERVKFPSDFLVRSSKSNADVAFEIMRPYVGGQIPDADLYGICSASIDFPLPLVRVTPRISILELFHGPTLAFKDVGARFMAGCLGHFAKIREAKTLVIVATSGDTGGAVADGFANEEGIEVAILYPKGRVSQFQADQLNTRRSNVTTLEVRGSFDDCQALAKTALVDPELRKSCFVTSANSINIARWLPQQFYYAFALRDWDGPAPIISVPSGNFGNLAAGALISMSGLPISRFIAACNANDTVPHYLDTGKLEPGPSIETLSNAMDVGDPSNLPRLMEIFDNDIRSLSRMIAASSTSDEETMRTIKQVFSDCNYVLDPHTAVGYSAISDYLEGQTGAQGIVLGTAHPRKFDLVEKLLGNYEGLTDQAGNMAERIDPVEIEVDYDQLREILVRLT